uniref:Uncharacterized protein n=1 Tax=Chromera velia CCMP2878 TaxID=1169474 RepID=A0A0K6S6X6_9ALVE|eukprot:Cvel_19750.t2-p1 / transcript=Cvel_19750.t2 / gene=Cvel_19750 / organism=Chromera_velia_CCMP2878 / gene_product=hypothetical protein / transcript_product=hypothetical protein / location=Cvel_scaffold1729:14200-15463(+) / protein_length=93 / sequence_SO=supercontig / SO=protein_coding / is_pseudo=false
MERRERGKTAEPHTSLLRTAHDTVEVLLETAHGGSTGSGSSVSLSMGREREDLPVPGAVALRLGDSSPAVPVVREGRLLSATGGCKQAQQGEG